MTNSQALITAQTLRIRLTSIQSNLDDLAALNKNRCLHSSRTLTALALTDAEELCAFLEALAERTLNPGATP